MVSRQDSNKTKRSSPPVLKAGEGFSVASQGVLYVVATPIGNLEDITFRAIRVLKEVDLIAAEDTRHSRKLLNHFDISTPTTSYFEHNQRAKGQFLVAKMLRGESIALITDAGTPCISDPGYLLVAEAVAAGVTVVPIPGACAAVAALSASGLPTDSFFFVGFLPSKAGKRRGKLAEIASLPHVVVLYESPQRLHDTLDDLLRVVGNRNVVVAREVTKIHEEFVRGTVEEVISTFADSGIKGEVIIFISPAINVSTVPAPDIESLLKHQLETEGVSVKEAVARVAAGTGLSRSAIYATALDLTRRIV